MKSLLYQFFQLTFTLIFTLGWLLGAKPVQAVSQTFDITCSGSGTCVLSNSDPSLFSEENIYPGYQVTHLLHVHNTADVDRTFNFYLKNFNSGSAENDLAGQIFLTIFDGDQPTTSIYGPASLAQLRESLVFLTNIPASSTHDYLFQLNMSTDANNSYQNLETVFDWQLGFDILTPPPSSSPETTGQTAGAQTQTAGNDATAPVCENPGLLSNSPTNFRVLSSGSNTVTLGWDATSNAQSYAIFFTRLDGAAYSVIPEYIQGATSFTITNLAASQYTFELIAVGGNQNLCSSPRASLTTSLTGGPVTGGPQTAAGQVLGITDESPSGVEPVTTSGEVAGISTQACTQWEQWLPWLLLGFQILFILGSEILQRHGAGLRKQVVVLVVTVSSIGLFYFFRNCDCEGAIQLQTAVCNWFWVLSILMSLCTKLLSFAFIEEVES